MKKKSINLKISWQNLCLMQFHLTIRASLTTCSKATILGQGQRGPSSARRMHYWSFVGKLLASILGQGPIMPSRASQRLQDCRPSARATKKRPIGRLSSSIRNKYMPQKFPILEFPLPKKTYSSILCCLGPNEMLTTTNTTITTAAPFSLFFFF